MLRIIHPALLRLLQAVFCHCPQPFPSVSVYDVLVLDRSLPGQWASLLGVWWWCILGLLGISTMHTVKCPVLKEVSASSSCVVQDHQLVCELELWSGNY